MVKKIVKAVRKIKDPGGFHQQNNLGLFVDIMSPMSYISHTDYSQNSYQIDDFSGNATEIRGYMARDIPVKLVDIIQGIEFQIDNSRSYINKITGRIVTISYYAFRSAKSDKAIEDYPKWQQETIKKAQEILETDDYIPIPSMFDIHEYNIMERFCLSITDEKLGDVMCSAIKGSGAFRRFRGKLRRYYMVDDWYKYRYEALKQIAIEWCEENDIEFIDN